MKRSLSTALLVAMACRAPSETHLLNDPIDLGFAPGVRGTIVVDGLMNPSSVAFRDGHALTVCDSGHGRVLVFDTRDGEPTVFADGFATEYWKVDTQTGTQRFLLGPLSALWLENGVLAVTDGGAKDGEERILFFDEPGKASEAPGTDSVSPTSSDPGDRGEGNLCGMGVGPDGLLYVCGQGSDVKTWILRSDPTAGTLEPFVSADEHGIEVNSPMQVLPWTATSILVLYSGAGGKDDGALVEWSLETREPTRQWSLLGLEDPMGMARIPGTDRLAIVDNRWSLTEVREGRLAVVDLPEPGGLADVRVVADRMQGPVACAFGEDQRLFVACLGERFDAGLGYVVAIGL